MVKQKVKHPEIVEIQELSGQYYNITWEEAESIRDHVEYHISIEESCNKLLEKVQRLLQKETFDEEHFKNMIFLERALNVILMR